MSNDPQYPTSDEDKNEKLLEASRPKSSRLINSDGEVVNVADAFVEEDGVLKIRATLS